MNDAAVAAGEVARQLPDGLRLEGPLDRRETTAELQDMFGGRLTRTNDAGGLLVAREVAALPEEFARAAGVTPVWRGE
jgi:hypothetical protein